MRSMFVTSLSFPFSFLHPSSSSAQSWSPVFILPHGQLLPDFPPASLQQQHQSSISPSHPVSCSLSVTWPSFHSLGSSYSAYLPCESHVMVHQCSCPVANSMPAMGGGGVSRLKHSNSAPSIGTSNHHRHSLQPLYSMSSDGQIFFNVGTSRRNMRRSSSELYASSGRFTNRSHIYGT